MTQIYNGGYKQCSPAPGKSRGMCLVPYWTGGTNIAKPCPVTKSIILPCQKTLEDALDASLQRVPMTEV